MSPVHARSPLQRLERLNRLYQVLSGINEAVVRSQSEADLFLAACRVAVQRGGFLLAAVVAPQAATGRVRPLVHFGDADGYFDEIHVDMDDEKLRHGTSATAMRTGRHDVCNDLATQARMAPWREQTQRRGFRASAAFPITLDGSVFGALVLFAGETDYFQQDEVELLVRVASDVSFAMNHLRGESQRRAAQAALAQSERQNKLILQSVGEGILGVDTNGRITFENPAALSMLGWAGHALVGRDVHEVVYGPGATCPGAACPYEQTMRDGQMRRVPDDTFVRKDGTALRVEYVCSPVTDEHGGTTGTVISFSDVTVDRRARDKLSESLSILRVAGRVARLGGWTIDLPGYQLTWSDENCAIHDVPPGYQPTLEEGIRYFLPEHRAQVRAMVEACARDGTPYEFELPKRTALGRLIWVRSVGEAVRGADGRIIRLQGAFQDITLRRQELEALRRSEVRFRLLFDNSQDGVLLTQPDGAIVAANRSACTIFGMSEQALIRAGRAGITDASDPRLAELTSARERDGAASGELRMLRAGGQPFEAEISSMVFDVANEADGVEQLTGIFVRDITVRQQAQRQLKAQLMRTALLHQITQAIGDRLDLDSVFQVVSDNVREHFPADFVALARLDHDAQLRVVGRVTVAAGLPDRLAGLPGVLALSAGGNELARCFAGGLIYEPDLAACHGPLAQALAQARLGSAVVAPLHTDGDVFGLLIVARAQPQAFSDDEYTFLRQLSGHAALAASQARLHGALRQAYIDLEQSQQTLLQQERLRAVGQMASGVAHDINNAISPVVLYTEALLENEPGLSERARGFLQTIQRAVDDVAKTVARMREFYRPNEAGLQGALVPLNCLVPHVVDLTRACWRDIPQKAGIAISVVTDLCADLPAIVAAEGEIRDALTNLVFNAVDAMPGGGTLTLRTCETLTPDGARRVVLEVADTGIGMDEATRRRCLEPFFTTKGQRGSGLGLPMVYGTVQRHAGEIEIDSAPGLGTRVRLLFPLPDAAAGAAVPAAPVPARAACGLRVLLVDDDPLVLGSLTQILRMDGHEVTTAAGGQEGIDEFARAQARGAPAYDLVMTDLGMPHIDGRQVAQAVKRLSPGTGVVLLTGWGQSLLDDIGLPEHVDRVMAKPARLDQVRHALAGHGH